MQFAIPLRIRARSSGKKNSAQVVCHTSVTFTPPEQFQAASWPNIRFLLVSFPRCVCGQWRKGNLLKNIRDRSITGWNCACVCVCMRVGGWRWKWIVFPLFGWEVYLDKERQGEEGRCSSAVWDLAQGVLTSTFTSCNVMGRQWAWLCCQKTAWSLKSKTSIPACWRLTIARVNFIFCSITKNWFTVS